MIGKIKNPAQIAQEKPKKQITPEMAWNVTKLSVLLGVVVAVALLMAFFAIYQNSLVSTQIAKHVEEHQLVLNRIICDDLSQVYNVYVDKCLTPEQDLKVRAWMVENSEQITKA